jgi:hypothetical protein
VAGDPLGLLASLRLEDGQSWGSVACPWQIADARAVLDMDGPRLHWLGRSKGSSKSTDLAGIGLAWLCEMARPLEVAYLVAGDAEQADRLLDRARGLIARTKGLPVQVQVSRITHVASGARLQVISSDSPTAEGILAGLICVDELPNWPPDHVNHRNLWAALFSSQAKTNCPLVVIGHAGRPGSWQHKLFERAQKSGAWRVADRSDIAPWISPEALEEQQATLLPFEFERRWRNRWVVGDGALASEALVRAAVRPGGFLEPETGRQYVIGLDLGTSRDHTGLAVCHVEPGDRGRRAVVDFVRRWIPSRFRPVSLSEVEQAVTATSSRYHGARLVFDPHEAVLMAERLPMRTEPFTATVANNDHVARTLKALIDDGLLSIPDTDDLLEEFLGMQLLEVRPGAVKLDFHRSAGSGHGDVVQAIALAASDLLAHATGVGSFGGLQLARRSLLPTSAPSAAHVRDAPRPGWGRGRVGPVGRPTGDFTGARSWDELISVRGGGW